MILIQLVNRRSGDLGHGAMQLIAEFAIAIHKADFLTMFGLMQCVEFGKMQFAAAHVLAIEHDGGGAIAE